MFLCFIQISHNLSFLGHLSLLVDDDDNDNNDDDDDDNDDEDNDDDDDHLDESDNDDIDHHIVHQLPAPSLSSWSSFHHLNYHR